MLLNRQSIALLNMAFLPSYDEGCLVGNLLSATLRDRNWWSSVVNQVLILARSHVHKTDLPSYARISKTTSNGNVAFWQDPINFARGQSCPYSKTR